MAYIFQGKKYYHNQGWGDFHPKSSYWFNPNCITVKKDIAILDINREPLYDKKFGCGQLVSAAHYLYGTFVWEYILPIGRNIWPAIWLTGSKTWPPEIDVMEGWTSKGLLIKNRRDYKTGLFSNYIAPTLHYRFNEDDEVSTTRGQLYNCSTLRHLQKTNEVNTCKLEWYPDRIKIWYNDTLILHITDKKLLDYYNQPMMVVMNTAITDKFTMENYVDYKLNGRPFKILSFKYNK